MSAEPGAHGSKKRCCRDSRRLACGLLTTLALIFAFQADNITTKTLHLALIAVPIPLQVSLSSYKLAIVAQ